MKFRDFIKQDEALTPIGGEVYPKFGQVLILAGGAGSGKGFILKNLIPLEGKVFDVDELKKLAIRTKLFSKRVHDETGHDIDSFNLKNPDEVSVLHEIINDVYKLPSIQKTLMYSSILTLPSDRKPNLIFDITLANLSQLESISRNVTNLGYNKENIHISWIANDFRVAIKQNKNRDRVVPEEILMSTHEGTSLTMRRILDMGDKLKKYMDGDITLIFNKEDVDVISIERKEPSQEDSIFKSKRNSKGFYIKSADYLYLKKKNKDQITMDDLSKEVLGKIKSYVPDTLVW